MRDQNKRAVLIEAVIAAGLIAIGIPTGQVPLLTLAAAATSMGCNWTHSLVERGFQQWSGRWFTDEGVLNHDITKELCHAFEEAVRQVEHDWKHHRRYQHLQRKSPEEARLTLDALRMLREEGLNFFQQPDHLIQIAQQEQHDRVLIPLRVLITKRSGSDGLLSHLRLRVDVAQAGLGSARLFGGHFARSSHPSFISGDLSSYYLSFQLGASIDVTIK